MRKIGFLALVLLVASCASCASHITEVKPLLKPRVLSIAQRIADQEKWLDQGIAEKTIKPVQAKPIRARLVQIREKYERLRSLGPLTREDSDAINGMLDQTSEQIFRIGTKQPALHTN